ncbi:hypothetical protein TWF481_007549 [Arthrobotrys musiformis]|uniref:Uncharacterized protein n=1 Tax=Arthrobotrys musiformis TaxID=47236 RepID=A0AAV9WBS5_9PEZI
MRYTTFLLALSVISTASSATTLLKCNADNCLRAIRATAPVFSTRKQSEDCSSFFKHWVTSTEVVKVTYTPKPTTVTEISGISHIGYTPCTPSPTSPTTPTYATPCSGFARFSSACACIGATDVASVYTTTSTVDTAAQEPGTATVVATSFHIKVSATAGPAQYLVNRKYAGVDSGTFLTTDINEATVYFFANDNFLLSSILGQPAAYANDFNVNYGGLYYGQGDSSYFCSLGPAPERKLDCESYANDDLELPPTILFKPFGVTREIVYPEGFEIPGQEPILLAGKPGVVWGEETFKAPVLLDPNSDDITTMEFKTEEVTLQAVPIAPGC